MVLSLSLSLLELCSLKTKAPLSRVISLETISLDLAHVLDCREGSLDRMKICRYSHFNEFLRNLQYGDRLADSELLPNSKRKNDT